MALVARAHGEEFLAAREVAVCRDLVEIAGELALARRLNLAVPVIVLNDGWLGLMKVKQERRNVPLSGVRLGAPPESPPHYFGVLCRSAKTAKDFSAALDWAFTPKRPSVIEAFIDAESYSATVFD